MTTGNLVSRCGASVCRLMLARRRTSCSASPTNSAPLESRVEFFFSRCIKLVRASSGLLISCAMVATRRPVAASFSERRTASSSSSFSFWICSSASLRSEHREWRW